VAGHRFTPISRETGVECSRLWQWNDRVAWVWHLRFP